MSTSGESREQDRPEQVLSAALRAQAAGNEMPNPQPQPSSAQPSSAQPSSAQPPTAQPSSAQPSTAQPPSPTAAHAPAKLPVVRVLLFVLVLGLLAGGIVGALTAV